MSNFKERAHLVSARAHNCTLSHAWSRRKENSIENLKELTVRALPNFTMANSCAKIKMHFFLAKKEKCEKGCKKVDSQYSDI